MTVHDWQPHAACRLVPPEVFFDDTSSLRGRPPAATRLRRWRAKQVCASCPVAQQCLEHALETRSDHGVFGGLDQPERTALRSPEPRPAHLVDLALRLRIDGLRWAEIARRMETAPEVLMQLKAQYPPSRERQRALDEYAAWPAVIAGMQICQIAARYSLFETTVMEMVKAVQELAAEERHGRNQPIAC